MLKFLRNDNDNTMTIAITPSSPPPPEKKKKKTHTHTHSRAENGINTTRAVTIKIFLLRIYHYFRLRIFLENQETASEGWHPNIMLLF